jgi:hypothetical protein
VARVSSTATSALVLILSALEWTIVDWLTPFVFLPLVEKAVWLFWACGLFAVVVMVLRLRSEGWRAATPVLIQAVALIVLASVPLSRIALDVDFRWYRGDREHVIELVRSGQLRPANGLENGLATLPAKFAHVSRGGEIDVIRGGDRSAVLFYAFRGVLDHYAGFVYSATAVPPQPADEIPWREIEQRDRYWWWVSR